MNSFFTTSGARNSVSDEALETWFELFGILRPEVFRKAIKLHCMSSRFQPTPNEIFLQIEAIRIDMFSKLNYQRSIAKTVSGEYELDEGENIEELKLLLWGDDQIKVIEDELEKLNILTADLKYGREPSEYEARRR